MLRFFPSTPYPSPIIKFPRLLLACLVLTSASAKDTPDKEVVDRTVGDEKLSLFIFNPEGHKASDKRPAIVFFFGGGWKGGSPSQYYPRSRYLASRGMVAICADHRTKKNAGTDPRKCLQDGKSAVRWIRSNAKDLGINPDKLAAGGGSAGGHVAATTGTNTKFDDPGENNSVSCRPNALVLFNPVYDNGPQRLRARSRQSLLEGFLAHAQSFKRDSSHHHLPGDQGHTHPSLDYKKRMRGLGVRRNLQPYDGEPHGFFNKAKYDETVLETDRFLTSLGHLQGKPTLKKK